MNPSTLLVYLLYGAALIFVIHFMMAKSAPASIIIQQPAAIYPDTADSSWWSFPITSYNYFPYWTGYYNGGGDGGYGYFRRDGPHVRPQPRPHFGGGVRGALGGRIGTPASGPGGRPGGGGGGGHMMGAMSGGHGGGHGGRR
jgi:hypothetical protein